jgi:ATP-dependent Clp protease ATP-binding subunit ClpA
MVTMEAKALIKLLTPTCIRALEAAVGDTVNRRHYEVCVGHLLRALLDDGRSDVSVLLAQRGVDTREATGALDGSLGGLRAGNMGRPTFAPQLLELFEDAYRTVAEPHDEKRIRSGAMLFLIAGDPARYGLDAAPFDAARLGFALYAPYRFAQSQEAAEVRLEAPRPPPPRLPRETIQHTVAEGETLIAVARRFAVDVEDVARDNDRGIHDPLGPGQVLRVRILPRDVVPRG